MEYDRTVIASNPRAPDLVLGARNPVPGRAVASPCSDQLVAQRAVHEHGIRRFRAAGLQRRTEHGKDDDNRSHCDLSDENLVTLFLPDAPTGASAVRMQDPSPVRLQLDRAHPGYSRLRDLQHRRTRKSRRRQRHQNCRIRPGARQNLRSVLARSLDLPARSHGVRVFTPTVRTHRFRYLPPTPANQVLERAELCMGSAGRIHGHWPRLARR